MKKDFTLPLATRKKLIIEALRAGKPVKCARLQDMCKCSDKTIRRTIEKLQDEHWPIESSNDGFTLREASSAEITFTQDSHFGVLMIAGCSIDKNIGKLIPGVGDHIKREIFDLGDVEETEDALLIDRCVDVPQSIYSVEQIKTFGIIARNIISELAISFDYKNVTKDKSATRSVYPIQLKLKNGMWYLLSFDIDRKGIRAFKLPKIQNVRICDTRWTKPSVAMIDKVLKSAQFSIWDRGDRVSKIRIKVKDHALEHVEHYELTPNQKIIQEGENTIVELETSDLIGVLSWCRHYVHNIKILSPLSLKEKFLHDLRVGFEAHSS